MKSIIAVSWSEYDRFGCVKCGCGYCYNILVRCHGTAPVKCGQCDEVFVVLAEGVTVSALGLGEPTSFPELQAHPRQGRPKHEYSRPDTKPDGGGEYWNPRGVGYDLAGFVQSKQGGERIIKMVQTVIGKTPQTRLDYREYSPDHIQVKFQSEDGFDLEKLCALCSDGVITEQRIRESLIN